MTCPQTLVQFQSVVSNNLAHMGTYKYILRKISTCILYNSRLGSFHRDMELTGAVIIECTGNWHINSWASPSTEDTIEFLKEFRPNANISIDILEQNREAVFAEFHALSPSERQRFSYGPPSDEDKEDD